jgi:uncharacterized protein (UPF0303 family)
MNIEEDLHRIAMQEERLRFEQFGPDIAWSLGNWLREIAQSRTFRIAIDIQTYGMPLFFCAMPSSTPDNVDWIRRKRNLVLRMCTSSYAIGLKLIQRDTTLEAQLDLPPRDYASHGGGFPILLVDGTCVGAITVSGLAQRGDHGLVVEAIAVAQGKSLDGLALLPE